MYTTVQPNAYIILRLPSGLHKVVQIKPNTNIAIGKFGTFPTNGILGRPYHFTYELLDQEDGAAEAELRVVPASELNAEALADEAMEEPESRGEKAAEDGFDIIGEDGEVLMRNNRLTIDDTSRQKLSMEEIEALKNAGAGAGRELIQKIIENHSALKEKTTFALAKYTLRKSRKFLKRVTVLPLDVSTLTTWMVLEKQATRILELREEAIALIGSWANVHYGEAASGSRSTEESTSSPSSSGRWLVVDETGGLIVASLAERMGILLPQQADDDDDEEENDVKLDPEDPDQPMPDADAPSKTDKDKKRRRDGMHKLSTSNTLTLVHANAQPNLSLLKYFHYNVDDPNPTHPLHAHLHTISWLQLLEPTSDSAYEEPEVVSDEVLATWKAGKRGAYFRKRRRWERTRQIIDATQAGGFDGLVVASIMDPVSIMRHLVPLVKGAGQVVVYSPTVESLTDLSDYYSKLRKAAFMARPDEERVKFEPDEDFPLNPMLLLGTSVQTSRVRSWQVLPGRTHPVMMSRGGAEGYVFTGTRVIPAGGKVTAKGKFTKRRKVETENGSTVATPQGEISTS